jgi:hypothetical protein
MIDTTTEKLIPLNAAAGLVPPARRGKRTHLSTLLRWILKGAKGPAGEVVYLEGIRIGHRWMTSREALQRFAERLTPRPTSAVPVSPPRTPGQRRRAAEAAERELDRIGI